MKTHPHFARSLFRRAILTTAMLPVALVTSASAADVILSGPQTLNIQPVFGEGLREGFLGKYDAANVDNETTPNPNRLGGALVPPDTDVGNPTNPAPLPDPRPPYNNTLDVRMGQINQNADPGARPDGFSEAGGLPYGWTNSRTFIYTGEIQITTSFLSFVMNNDDSDWLKINGVVVLDDNAWDTGIQARSGGAGDNLNSGPASGIPNLVAGLGLTLNNWYDVEFRISDFGGGGEGPSGQQAGGGSNWTGTFGVGINTTGFQQDGTTPLGTSLNAADYIKPEEPAGGGPTLFRYLINPGGGDDVHVTGNTVTTLTGASSSVLETTVTENSLRFEPTVAGATVNLTLNSADTTQRTFIANSTILANSNNVVANVDGSATVRLNNLDDNGKTGVVLNKNGGTGDLIISGTAAVAGLDGAIVRVTDGRLIVEGATDPLVGLNTIQINGPNGKLRIRTTTGTSVSALESGTLEHPDRTSDVVQGNLNITGGKTLLADISDGILGIGGNLIGGILNKIGVGGFAVNGTTNVSAVTVNGGGRLELNGQATLASVPTLVSGTLALLNLGTGLQANSIPGPIAVPTGTTLEGTLTAFVDSTGAADVINLNGGTLRYIGRSGLNLSIYDSDPRTTGAYSGALDTFAGMQAHYAGLVSTLRTITSNNANTIISYNPSGDGSVPFAIHGSTDADTIEALFTGKFIAATAGDYMFEPFSDDGSQVFIDGTLVINNNFAQGIRSSGPGTITLTAGAHDIVMTFNEGIGGAGMYVNVTPPGGTARPLANSDLLTTTVSAPAANAVNVVTDSTIDAVGIGVAMNSLSIQPGKKLTVTGSSLTANTVTLNGSGTYTFDGAGTVVATTLDDNSDGTVLGGPFDVDIIKTGTGVLVLDNTTTPQLQNGGPTGSSITVTGGSVGLLLGGALQPLGNASINFNGGGVVLSSKAGNQNFAIPTFNGNGSLEARQLGSGVPGPVTITLTGNLNVAPTQTVALGTADGYKISLGGTAAGNGTVVIKSGEVETTTSTALQNLNLVVGQTAPTTLRLTAVAPNLLSLGGSNNGTMIVGPGTAPAILTIGGGANARFDGAITQNNNQVVSLVKNGTNTQTLGGVNTFTGGVTVNAGTLELRSGSIGTNAITLSGGTLQFIGTGLSGQFYSGDDAGANANFNTFANYSSYFASRTPTAVSSTDVPTLPTLSFAPGGGNTQMYADYGFTDTDNLVSRMSGRINIPTDGSYTFSTRSDDGSMLYIDGQTVVANNFYQGLTTRSGSVVLTSGVHDIDIGFYEGGGDNGLVVQWQGPGFALTDIPNTVLETTGAYNSQANAINMTSSSTIDARGGTLSLGAFTLAAGTTLTTTAGSVGFTQTTLPAAGAYTFNVAGTLIPGTVVDAGNAVTINKLGAGNLLFNSTAAELTNAGSAINVTEGTVTAVLTATANPLGNAAVNLNGGGLRLSSSAGDVTFARPIQINQNATLEAGNFGGGAVDGVVASVTSAVSVASGRTLTVRSSNDYTLRLGAVGGAGNMIVDGGVVGFAGATTPNTLTVNSGVATVTTGTLTPVAGATVNPLGTLGFDPGANNTATYAKPLAINGGTIRAQSGTADLSGATLAFSTTSVPNLLLGRFLGTGGEFAPSLYPGNTEAGIAAAKSLTAVESRLSGPLSFLPYQAADAAFSTFFGGVNAAQRFTAGFFGTFTAPVSGDFRAQSASIDDLGGFWIDLNQNGIFEQGGSLGSELISSQNCCGDGPIGTVPLVAGQKYQVAIAVEDTGGGSSIVGRLGLPTGGMFTINPSDPAQAGYWAYDAVGGNVLIDPGAQLRASSITGANDVNLSGNGARLALDSAAATTSTIGVLRNAGLGGELATVNLGANSSLVAGRFEVVPDTTFIKSGAGTLTATLQTLAPGSTLQIDAGTVVLNGPDTDPANTGAVQVNAGLLRVNGAISGAVTVAAPGTLGGTGQVGVATVQGQLAPGVAGVGTITTADLALNAGTLTIEVQDLTAYDKANVAGTVTLANNPLLSVTRLGGGPLQNNDLFFIVINDDGGDAVIGQFGSIPNQGQGRPTLADVNGQRFLVSYYGDSSNPTASGFDVPGGNDIVLQAIPEPQTWATLLSSMGALAGLQRFRRRR